MTAAILEFPYARIVLKLEKHEAKILKLPVKPVNPVFWPMMFWLEMMT